MREVRKKELKFTLHDAKESSCEKKLRFSNTCTVFRDRAIGPTAATDQATAFALQEHGRGDRNCLSSLYLTHLVSSLGTRHRQEQNLEMRADVAEHISHPAFAVGPLYSTKALASKFTKSKFPFFP